MKNIVIIDMDTERPSPIIIGKAGNEPDNLEDGGKMILSDIKTVTAGLVKLIELASNNKITERKVLVENSINILNKLL